MRSLTTEAVYLISINSRIVIMMRMITFLKPLISFLFVVSHLLTSVRGSRGTHLTTFLWHNYFKIKALNSQLFLAFFICCIFYKLSICIYRIRYYKYPSLLLVDIYTYRFFLMTLIYIQKLF